MKRPELSFLAATWMLAGLFVLAGCKEGPAWKDNVFSSRTMKNEIDVKLPASLLSQIGTVLKGAGGSEKPAGADGAGEGARSTTPLPSEFSPLKVYLIERNRGILGRENFELTYGPGGGELDLQDFVLPYQGSFYFLAEFMPALEKAERRVFFLSNSIVRELDGDVFGTGCDTYFDVTSAFAKATKGNGFLVNTTRGRHVSALAGTYFFVAVAEGKLYLARLTVRDSGLRDLQCRR